MLLDKVRKFYDVKYDLNCAETILYAADEEYNLTLDKNTFKTMSAFGGGMAIESVCGVITGSIAVLGILFTIDRGHEGTRVKELTAEFISKFKEKCNAINCDELKALHKNDEIRCTYMIEAGALILDEIVRRELSK